MIAGARVGAERRVVFGRVNADLPYVIADVMRRIKPPGKRDGVLPLEDRGRQRQIVFPVVPADKVKRLAAFDAVCYR